VVFAFHGYQRAIHEIVHGRPRGGAVSTLRGFNGGGDDHHAVSTWSSGTASAAINLCIEAPPARAPAMAGRRAAPLIDECTAIADADTGPYVREHLEDLPEVRDWDRGPMPEDILCLNAGFLLA